MKFTLKDYQDDAVKNVLTNLSKARKRWKEDGDKHAFSLTATTGAGKTVMAAAVFESLFFGSDDYDFDADDGAVVIWFSDDPSLNEQSRFRLMEASDKLNISSLVNVDNTFSKESLEPGKIYFLNTQKLSKNSLLVRGHDSNNDAKESVDKQMRLMPDLRSHTIWDTIQNTIENPDLTLYLVLDEAHRGMKEGRTRGDSKPTIVKQLINGTGATPGIPIVWGISATVDRFNEAIAGMESRATLPNVVVNSKLVQESGLLKDTINLDIPVDTGNVSTVLLRRGAEKLREISYAWKEYSRQQKDSSHVSPLMVLQVPNSPDHDEIGSWIETIFETWPELNYDCVYNVFGEHKTEFFGNYKAPYIPPERVQESEWVRILVAKDAISTGWDCPRAEVMVSFRSATDKTHITQLLGRMVRTPLARRIPGDERLNSVDCLLPHFNKSSVEEVVNSLISGGDSSEDPLGRRVLINPCEVKNNPNIPTEVWDKLQSLPSQTLPKKQSRPIKRLTALAHELAADDLLADAGKISHAKLHKLLDGALVTYDEEVKKAKNTVLTVEGQTVKAEVGTDNMSFDDFVEAADYTVIEDAYKRAGRALSPDLCKTYSEHLSRKTEDIQDDEESLIEAHTIIASIGMVDEIREYIESEAEKLANQWLNEFRVPIKNLTDDRQEVYRQIRESSNDPLDVDLALPKKWLQPTTAKEPDGSEVKLPMYERHLLCDENGMYPELLNSWESHVLTKELNQEGTIAWYRNPSRASQDSLGIIYSDGSDKKVIRPDFIFFSLHHDGTCTADIIDPHGHHLSDALPKLKGLAEYAEKHGGFYRRIEAISEVSGVYKLLDLKEKHVRTLVLSSSNAKEVYESEAAISYS